MVRALFIIMLLFASPARAATAVDLALVLAVDASGSVDGEEYALQMNGIALAITSPDVMAAARSGPHGRIAVCLMVWGDPDEQKFANPWRIIGSEADALDFAVEVRKGLPRPGGGTGLAQAISFGLTLLRQSGVNASREVIDISGDGRESWELREPRFRLAEAQVLREATGVTVNGLAILTDVKDLTSYYRTSVIGGSGAFAMQAATYDDFADAMRRKLLREIIGPISMR